MRLSTRLRQTLIDGGLQQSIVFVGALRTALQHQVVLLDLPYDPLNTKDGLAGFQAACVVKVYGSAKSTEVDTTTALIHNTVSANYPQQNLAIDSYIPGSFDDEEGKYYSETVVRSFEPSQTN